MLNGVEDNKPPSLLKSPFWLPDSLDWKKPAPSVDNLVVPPPFFSPLSHLLLLGSQYNQTKQFNALQIDAYLQKSVLLIYYEIFVENTFFNLATKVESDVSPTPPPTSGLNHLSSAIAAPRSTVIHTDL